MRDAEAVDRQVDAVGRLAEAYRAYVDAMVAARSAEHADSFASHARESAAANEARQRAVARILHALGDLFPDQTRRLR